jgi:hypothetical protein
MLTKSIITMTIVLVVPGLFSADAVAGVDGHPPAAVSKTSGTPSKTYMNINNISTVIANKGFADIDVQEQNSGFVFPKGSGKAALFQSGFLWGGIVSGQVRVGGSAYRTGLTPGKILPSGQAEDPNLPSVRIYRVRPDYRTASLTAEVADEGLSPDAIRAQYELDWNEWPAADGAPFNDVNGNGTYEPDTDIPGVKGADQTIWYVANDLDPSKTTFLYGSNPIKIELRVTMWAYSSSGALGNMMFRAYKIINRSGLTIDSMYVSQWSDPDLGNSTDDFAGCDVPLSLAYIYNANASDDTYRPLPPPAAGFDFFQGPVVDAPGDSAIFNGQRIYGKRNLPMTAFYYFARGDANVTDPTQGSYEGTTQFYNFFRGRIGKTGEFFVDPTTNEPTTYALSGDPQTRTGWIDGQLLPAGDRRLGMASGPFSMAPLDTQEVVVAAIAAGAIPGTDRLSAIGLLKFYDQQAQLAYDNFFDLPVAPPAPKVSVVELDREIVLNWGEDASAIAETEKFNSKGYIFQGYNVYQLPSASAGLSEAKRIATYDVIDGIGKIEDFFFDPTTGTVAKKVVQFGNDTGIRRYIRILNDDLNGGTPLINGIRYYFAVTAYSYNLNDPVPNNLENPLAILTTVAHPAGPGRRFGMTAGDTVAVTQTTAAGGSPSDGRVYPVVVDPTKTTGHGYTVSFSDDGSGQFLWTLKDATTGQDLLVDQENQTGDETYAIVDGLQVKVLGPPPGMKDYDIPGGERKWTWSNADWSAEGFNGAIGNAFDQWFSGSTVAYADLRNVLIKFAGTDSLGNVLDPNDPNWSFGYRYLRGASAAPALPEFGPFIVNPGDGYAFQDYNKSVPFAAFNAEDNPPTRLTVGFLENNVAEGLVDGKYWPGDGSASNVAGASPREFFFIFSTPYSETPDPQLQVDILNTTVAMMWMGTPNRRGDVTFDAGDEFLILANHINSAANTFSFTAPSPSYNVDVAREDIRAINVFPNPYYGVNTEELNKYQRFVTFSHLPQRATIRIFNLAGIMVRVIEKDNSSTFERWNLSNESGLPVGSGLYIAHIDMPDLGTTKVLKLAIIQEAQILDRF